MVLVWVHTPSLRGEWSRKPSVGWRPLTNCGMVMLYVVGDLGQHRWYCRRLLMGLSHHLDQCWLFSRQVLCHSYEGNFRANAQASAGIVPRVWKLHFYISNDLRSSWVMEDVPWWRKSKLQYLVVDVVVSYNRQCPFIVISTTPVDTYHKGPVPRTSDVFFVVRGRRSRSNVMFNSIY